MTHPDHVRQNATRALRTVRLVLETIGWDPRLDADGWTLHVEFEEDEIPVSGATAAIMPDLERFLFYLNFRVHAPEQRRACVAEFTTRVNAGLIIGNFEMSYDDGALRYKSSVDFTQVALADRMIRNTMLSAMDAVEHYAPYLSAAITGPQSARAVCEAADGALAVESVA